MLLRYWARCRTCRIPRRGFIRQSHRPIRPLVLSQHLYLLLHLHHLLPHLCNHIPRFTDVILLWIWALWGLPPRTESPLQIIHLLLPSGPSTLPPFYRMKKKRKRGSYNPVCMRTIFAMGGSVGSGWAALLSTQCKHCKGQSLSQYFCMQDS